MNATKTNFIELIQNKDWRGARLALNELQANEIVKILVEVPNPEKIILFRLLSRKRAKQVFKLLPLFDQQEIVEALYSRPQKAATLLNDIRPDD